MPRFDTTEFPKLTADGDVSPLAELVDGLAMLTTLRPELGQTTHEQVAAEMRKIIVLRAFPGDRLPSERELSRSLGVSRMTVRGAIQLLKSEGLVSTSPGRGGGTFQRRVDPLADWRSQATQIRRDLSDLLDYRSHLEELAVRIATRQYRPELAERLGRAVALMDGDPDQARFRHADTAFHLGIAEQARNRHLFNALASARAELFIWIDLLPLPYEIGDAPAEHRTIAAAIESGDEERAVTEIRVHMEVTRTHVVSLIDSLDGV